MNKFLYLFAITLLSMNLMAQIDPYDNVKVRNTDKVTFRVTDSFEITGPFQVDSGGEMTVIMQQCPE
mgnify:CR=1 FL=1